MTSGTRQPLNDIQLRALRWIADGCPDGVMTGSTLKISAVALQSRRLVKVSRRQGKWSAVITEAGTYYLEHGDYPHDPPLARAPGLPSPAAVPAVVPSEESAPSPANQTLRAEHASGGQAQKRRVGPTDAMIAALRQSNHRFDIAYHEADRYEQLSRTAMRFKKVPEGMRVRVERNWSERTAWVILEHLPSWMTAKLDPIKVAPALRQPTDVVTHLRNRDDFAIRHSEVNRALRLIDALVLAARNRGYAVQATEAPRKDRWGYLERHEGNRGQFVIALCPDRYQLTVSQEHEKVPHMPTKAEQAQAAREYAYIPKFDPVVTPHLRLTVEGDEVSFWRSVWSDKQGPPLEESLAQVLQELELRHERAEQRRHDEARQREERQRQWKAARANAIEQLIQAHRAKVLQEQVQRWELAHRVRAYVAAMEMYLESCTDPQERQGAEDWLRWARDYAQQIDPLNAKLRMPDDPKPTEEALKPFMKGWDPYGPY